MALHRSLHYKSIIYYAPPFCPISCRQSQHSVTVSLFFFFPLSSWLFPCLSRFLALLSSLSLITHPLVFFPLSFLLFQYISELGIITLLLILLLSYFIACFVSYHSRHRSLDLCNISSNPVAMWDGAEVSSGAEKRAG
jgi:hypothetical protein